MKSLNKSGCFPKRVVGLEDREILGVVVDSQWIVFDS
jgi:hypothetical protein